MNLSLVNKKNLKLRQYSCNGNGVDADIAAELRCCFAGFWTLYLLLRLPVH